MLIVLVRSNRYKVGFEFAPEILIREEDFVLKDKQMRIKISFKINLLFPDTAEEAEQVRGLQRASQGHPRAVRPVLRAGSGARHGGRAQGGTIRK